MKWTKYILVLLLLFLTACSALPFEVSLQNNAASQPAAAADPKQGVTTCPTCPPDSCATVTAQPTYTALPTYTLAPTYTSVPTQAPTATQTPVPTNTPTAGPSPTATVPEIKPYIVQLNSPVYLQNFANSSAGCNWMGIAGQVFDKQGNPLPNLVVVVEGFLNDRPVEEIGLTSLATAYGPGGYEIQLASNVSDTSNSLFVTLYDLSGQALTYPLPFNTYNDCNRNLILVNFQQRP
ncbi:MAG: hypothetical protein GYA17_21340 [Chloroflexi bacterium]|jgi:hypothetical protein|nr:hypothetical protein [Anaerolineaceae bacterium]NMB90915.1 hypothetical protein [Chloroflexota bacterium]